MSDLRKRFLNISKCILGHVQSKGFKKKGAKCILENGDLTYVFSTSVPGHWLNSENLYGFHVSFSIEMNDPKLVELYKIIDGNKRINCFSPLLKEVCAPMNNGRAAFLTPNDPEGHDQDYINQCIQEIDKTYLPLTKEILSIDDMIALIEKEYQLERSERFFFGHKNIYMDLEIFYAFKKNKQKTIEILENEINVINKTVVHLVEKRHKKYLEYFKNNNIE